MAFLWALETSSLVSIATLASGEVLKFQADLYLNLTPRVV